GEPLLSADNQWLMVLAEQGTVGIAAFGGLLGTLAVGALRGRRPLAGTATGPATGAATGKSRLADRFLDLAAPGILMWTLIDFMYGDVGAGPTGVFLAILLGLVARRSIIVPATAGEPS